MKLHVVESQPRVEPSKVRLVEWVWDLYGKGQILEAVDKGLSMEFDKGQIESLMVVGLWCCHPDTTSRPSIGQVIHVRTRPNTITLGRAFEARPKVSSEAAFKARPKGGLRPRFCRGYRPGLGPRFKKCGLRLHGPIVARFRPREKTRPNKPRPKAQRALGRVFRSYGRVFKTRPQKLFFVVNAVQIIL